MSCVDNASTGATDCTGTGGGGTECSSAPCDLNAATTLDGNPICVDSGGGCGGGGTTSSTVTTTSTSTVTTTSTSSTIDFCAETGGCGYGPGTVTEVTCGVGLVCDPTSITGTGEISLATTTSTTTTTSTSTSIPVFRTMDAPSGTDPVADAVDDTLELVAGTGLSITGDATNDRLTFALVTTTSTSTSSTSTTTSTTTSSTFQLALAGDTGSSQTITNGNTITIATGADLTATAGATDTVTITADSTLTRDSEVNTCSALATTLGASEVTGTCGDVVLSTSPTFVTQIETPKVLGSTAEAGEMLLQSTSGTQRPASSVRVADQDYLQVAKGSVSKTGNWGSFLAGDVNIDQSTISLSGSTCCQADGTGCASASVQRGTCNGGVPTICDADADCNADYFLLSHDWGHRVRWMSDSNPFEAGNGIAYAPTFTNGASVTLGPHTALLANPRWVLEDVAARTITGSGINGVQSGAVYARAATCATGSNPCTIYPYGAGCTCSDNSFCQNSDCTVGTNGTGTATTTRGFHAIGPAFNTGWTLTEYNAFDNTAPSGTGGTLTTVRGFRQPDITDNRITNAAVIESALTASSGGSDVANKWFLRSTGDAPSVLAGKVAIGTTTLPTEQLEVIATPATGRAVLGDVSGTVTGAAEAFVAFSKGLTLNAGTVTGLVGSGTITLAANTGVFGAGTLMTDNMVWQTDGSARTTTGIVGYGSNPQFDANGVALTMNAGILDQGAASGFFAAPTWKRTSGSSTQTAASYRGVNVSSLASIGAGWTVTDYIGYRYAQPGTITGTITNQIGVDIGALTSGTTQIGLRNADTTVYTPSSAQTISAASNTILCNATVVMISNTTGSDITLTSAPTIANGQDGQLCTIVNVSASGATRTVTLQDQGTLASSNLRLTANTLAPDVRDSLQLMYSSTIGDWVQVGTLVNVL